MPELEHGVEFVECAFAVDQLYVRTLNRKAAQDCFSPLDANQ